MIVRDITTEAEKKQKQLDQITLNIEKAKKELRDLRQNVKSVRSTQAHLLGANSADMRKAFKAIAEDEEEDATATQERAASSGQEHQAEEQIPEGMDAVFEGFD